MFDAQNHELDPASGLMVHKDTGHLVGIEQAPPATRLGGAEWPKWITPHDSQIVRQLDAEGKPVPGGHVSTPGWSDYHVNRADGSVTVLVANEDEEKRALGEYKAENPEAVPVVDEKIARAVQADVARAQQAQAEAAAAEDAKVHAAMIADEVARRAAEKVESEAAAAKAAFDLAEAQRKRLAEKIGAPIEPHVAPAAVAPPEPAPTPVTPPQVEPTAATRPTR